MRHPVWNGLYLIPKLRKWLRWQLWPLRLQLRLEFQFLFFPSFLNLGLNQTGYFFALLEPEDFVSVANFIFFFKIQRFCKPFKIAKLFWWYMESKSWFWLINVIIKLRILDFIEMIMIILMTNMYKFKVDHWVVVMNA